MSIVQEKAGLLIVPDGARIPKVCLKCGAKKNVVRRDQTYVVGILGRGGPWVGAGIGAGMAAGLRQIFRGDHALIALAIGVISLVVVVGALAVYAASRKIVLALPLCEEHDAHFELARRRRPIVLAAVGVGLAAALAGMAAEIVGVVLLGILIVVVAAIAARSTRMHEAFVPAAHVSNEHVLLHIDPELARDIAERARKRETKHQAERARRPGRVGAAE